MGSTNLAIPFIATNQSSPEITANAAINALDKAMNSPKSLALSDADFTVSTSDFISNIFLSFDGTDTVDRNIILPILNVDGNPLSKIFIAENLTVGSPSGNFGLTFTTESSPPGSTVTLLPSDGPCWLYTDGTNVLLVGKLVGTTSGTVAAGDDTRIAGAEQTVNKFAVPGYPGIVAAPAHFGSTGTAGSFAFGTDGGSPPVDAFFVCVSTNNWLRITVAGTFSNAF